MSLITDQSTLFSFTYLTGYTGQSSGSTGSQDFTTQINGAVYTPITSYIYFNSLVKITTKFNIYYKMQGWNPITQKYENWHSMGTPLLNPPSGHTLQNIGIIGTWRDR